MTQQFNLAPAVSLLGLVENGTIDLRIASLLWFLAEKKASVIVAAPPSLAGKTTVLEAMVSMAPPWYQVIAAKGEEEDFSFLSNTDPRVTYVLVHEISDHLPTYLWGSKVRTMFEALAMGYSLVATMHAGSAEEVVSQLTSDELGVPEAFIKNLDVVIILHKADRLQGVVRRVQKVHCMLKQGDDSLRFVDLATLDVERDELAYGDSSSWSALAQRFDMRTDELIRDLDRRGRTLEDWLWQGLSGTALLRQAVEQYNGGCGA